MLRDMNTSDPIASDYTYDEAIDRHAFLLSSRAYMVPTAVQTVSLVASTYEYTMTGVQAQSISSAILNSTGRELVFVPWDEFNAYWRQDSAEPQSSGTPVEYSFREKATDPENDLLIRFGPTPSATDAVDIFIAQLLEQGATPAPAFLGTAGSTVIPFPDDLIRGLQLLVAAEIAGVASEDRLAKRGLSANAARVFASQAEPAIKSYNVRARRMSQQDHRLRSARERRREVRV